MEIKIIHDTTYEFGSPIFLEPHYIRLMPKTISGKQLNKFSLQIDPQPAGIRQLADEEGNNIYFAWFDGLTSRLHIRSESVVAVSPYNTFDFLIFPMDFQTIPFSYTDSQRTPLSATLSAEKIGQDLYTYGENLLLKKNHETLPFLTILTARIHTDFELIYREIGPPMAPDETFSLQQGSCRDLSWMQINLLRTLGIAARFVSGYFYMDSETFELHAWLEVFVPGGGWIGFDPSHGIAASDTHIPVVTAANFESTMPVTGTFRGEAHATLTTNVSIEAT